jgi:hypothetical protein
MPKPTLAVSAVFPRTLFFFAEFLNFQRRGAGRAGKNSWLILTDLRCQRVRTSLRFYVMS